MSGEERRKEILRTIKMSPAPVSGAALAKMFQVSRQVIVQDIALLRAGDCSVIATPRGYLMQESPCAVRVFTVLHSDEQIASELNAIVDQGGQVLDVFVDHKVYGKLKADLNIKSRRDVERLVESIQNGESRPLKNLTRGLHCHTVKADAQEDLDAIESALKQLGVLV